MYTLIKTLQGHTQAVSACKFSPCGKMIATCSADATVCLWDVNGNHSRTFKGHSKGISDVGWSTDSLFLLSCSDDETARIWDINADTFTVLKGHTAQVFCGNFNPQTNLVVTGSFDETVRIWDIKGTCLYQLPAHSDPVSACCFNRDGTLVVSSGYDGLVRIWDTATGQCLRTIIDESNIAVSFCKFSPNGKYILSATFDSVLRLWDLSGKCIKTYSGHVNKEFCTTATFNCVGDFRVVCGSEDGAIFLWDLQSRNITSKIEAHQAPVISTSCHPVEDMIVSCSIDRRDQVKIWKNVETESTQ